MAEQDYDVQVDNVSEAEAEANESRALAQYTGQEAKEQTVEQAVANHGQVTLVGQPTQTEDDATEEDNGNEEIAVEEVQAGSAETESAEESDQTA